MSTEKESILSLILVWGPQTVVTGIKTLYKNTLEIPKGIPSTGTSTNTTRSKNWIQNISIKTAWSEESWNSIAFLVNLIISATWFNFLEMAKWCQMLFMSRRMGGVESLKTCCIFEPIPGFAHIRLRILVTLKTHQIMQTHHRGCLDWTRQFSS